jgi:hypothetical protein
MNEKDSYPEDTLDQIMLLFDTLFRAGKFFEANQLLSEIRLDDNDIQPVIMVGILSAVSCAKEHLPFYETFLDCSRIELLKRLNDPMRVNSLLKGF